MATKHGHSRVSGRSPTYEAWNSMLTRCLRSYKKGRRDYKDRGITVCQRWRKFENFLADMGEKPAGLMLDRIDNDGNYEPGNCRWTNRQTQNINRHNTKLTMEKAIAICLCRLDGEAISAIARRFHIDRAIVSRICSGERWRGAMVEATRRHQCR